MPSVDDLLSVLEVRDESYYIIPITYGYFFYKLGGNDVWFYMMLATAFAATHMYTEEYSPSTKSPEFEELRQTSPWMAFEIITVLFWMVSAFTVFALYLFWINWQRDIWLAVLGFLNVVYLSRGVSGIIRGFEFEYYRKRGW